MRFIQIHGKARDTVAHVAETIAQRIDEVKEVIANAPRNGTDPSKLTDLFQRLDKLESLNAVTMVWGAMGYVASFAQGSYNADDDASDVTAHVVFRDDGEIMGAGPGGTMGAVFRHLTCEYTFHT